MLTGARARKLAESHAQTHIYAEVQIRMLCRRTYTDSQGRTCTDVSNEITVVHRSTCPYISTKGTGVHGVMSMYNSTIKAVVLGRMNAYDEYGRY